MSLKSKFIGAGISLRGKTGKMPAFTVAVR